METKSEDVPAVASSALHVKDSDTGITARNIIKAKAVVRVGDDRLRKFLPVAEAISDLSKDRSTKVGAIALGPHFDIRATGYNGMPRGCNENDMSRHERPEKYLWFEHAERNLVYNAARNGVKLEGCTLIVTPLPPCMDCARAIVQSGFVRVIAASRMTENSKWRESVEYARRLFAECGVDYTEWRLEDNS